MSQPDDDYQPIPAHAIYLLAMCISVTAAFVLLLFDLSDEFSIPRGAYALLAAAIVVFGAGYLVRSAEEQVARRIDRRQVGEDERFRRGYATGYVDGAAGRTPEPKVAQLHSLNGRADLSSGR